MTSGRPTSTLNGEVAGTATPFNQVPHTLRGDAADFLSMSARQLPRTKPRSLPGWLDAALSIGVVSDDSAETVRTRRLFTALLWVSLPMSVLTVLLLTITQSAPWAATALMPLAISAAASLIVLWRWPLSYPNIAHLVIGAAVLKSAALVVMAGGLFESGTNSVWAFLGVLLAVVILTDWRATIWLWIFIATQVIAVIWAGKIEPIFAFDSATWVTGFNPIVVSIFTYYIIYYYARQRSSLLEESDDLLRNILPAEIAERLKASSDAIADDFQDASVLFADVVDFTPMSASLAPRELVGLLDDVFSAIDALVEVRGLEKIKTIGDAYVAASGVPHPQEDHAEVLCDLALEIHKLTDSRTFTEHHILFRIGTNSGPVVAGIIGTTKFSYDLWGDTVNIASRMKTSAADGTIQLTNATRRLVESRFDMRSRGVIDVKGAGEMPVWTIVGSRSVG